MLNHTDMTTEVLAAMGAAIMRAVGKRADVADIMQDAVVECLDKGEAFDATRGKVATFCAKIAGNVARNHAKYESYRGHDVMTKTDEGTPGLIVEGLPGEDGRAEAIRSEQAKWLAEAFATLPDDERAFIRAINQGLNQTEAGALVGWSPATATRRRKAIAEKMAVLLAPIR